MIGAQRVEEDDIQVTIDVGLMSAQRRRRWTNLQPAAGPTSRVSWDGFNTAPKISQHWASNFKALRSRFDLLTVIMVRQRVYSQ